MRLPALVTCLCVAPCLVAQTGVIDPVFDPPATGQGSGASWWVNKVVVLPSGQIMIAGLFNGYNGVLRNNSARLNADGSLDPTYVPAAFPPNWYTGDMAVQSDGKVLVSNAVMISDGPATVDRIVRYDINGALDPTWSVPYSSGSGLAGGQAVFALLPHSGGGCYAGGYLYSMNGTGIQGWARFSNSGAVDGTGPLVSNAIGCLDMQPDGKLLVGGLFGATAVRRYNHSGYYASLDTTFAAQTNGAVRALKWIIGGRVLAAGNFTTINGVTRSRIARLNADATVDTTFQPGSGADAEVRALAVQADGKMIIGGDLTSYNGIGIGRVVRLNVDGSIDNTFNTGTGANSAVLSIALQPDGRILLAGTFTDFNGAAVGCLVRLNSDGSVDATFNAISGPNSAVLASAALASGQVIIGGAFTAYGQSSVGRLARLNNDASLDMTFQSTIGANDTVHAIVIQPDGKVLIAGSFTSYNGTARSRIARLNSDGTLDVTFNPGTGANARIVAMALRPDGRIAIAGDFSNYNGFARSRLACLNSNGTLDTGFDPGTSVNNAILAIAALPDNKILIGGMFTSYNTVPFIRLGCVNTNGTGDMTFMPGTSVITVRTIAVRSDGRIMLGGAGLQRRHADGTADPSFVASTLNQQVQCLLLQADGSIIIGGSFTEQGALSRSGIAMLEANGASSTAFDPVGGFQGGSPSMMVRTIALHPDGRLIAGGTFSTYAGTGRRNVVRLKGAPRCNVKVLLEGPYAGGGLMNDALRTLPDFPLIEPFSALGYSASAFVPGAIISSTTLAVSGNNALLDWVLVELRSPASPATVIAARAAILQRDGDVVDLDGISPMLFRSVSAGGYCVVVRARNHLPVMQSIGTPTTLGEVIPTVNFTLLPTQVWDIDARKNSGGTMVVCAGDVNYNGTVAYTGIDNDRDPILNRIGGVVPTISVAGYWIEDVNMDGVVKYTGTANDRDYILTNIGGVVPTNTRVATLP